MNEVLFQITALDWTLTVTGWKIIGFLGALMFGGRWFVQAVASHFARRPILPVTFWYMSLTGSVCLTGYFIWGKNDSVGILSNLFPLLFTLYNIFLHFTHLKRGAEKCAPG